MRKRQRSAHHHAGSRLHLRRVNAKPTSRQQSALTWKISLAGWPPSKSAELLPSRPLAVLALRCWEFLPLRARQAAQRYTRRALCLEQAQGPAASVFQSGQFARSLQKAKCLFANLSTLAKYLQSWQHFGVDPGCGNFRNGARRSSRRSGVGLAAALTVRPRRPTRRPLVTRRSFSSCRLAQGRSRTGVSKETAGDTHWQGNAQSQERAPLRRRRQFAEANSRRGEADPPSGTARTGRQGCKGQRRRGKLRPGRDLRDTGPARLRDRAQCFPRHQNGWPIFLHYCPLFPGKQSSRKLSVTTLGGVGSRCQPAHAIVRAATATKHELGLSTLMSCCLVRLSNGGLGPPDEIVSLPAVHAA